MRSKVVFDKSLSTQRREVVSLQTICLLSDAATTSNNPLIRITSTIRTPQEQAEAMYGNLIRGANIRYASAGQQVIEVYNKQKGAPMEEVIRAMVEKIEYLSTLGQRVSRHCVTPAQYAKLNVIDVSRNMPSPIPFVRELLKSSAVSRIIVPFNSTSFKDTRILTDINEPAIHIEIAVS